MRLQETAAFVGNVLLIFALGVIYVAGLTLGTIGTAVKSLFKAVTPSSDQERDQPTF